MSQVLQLLVAQLKLKGRTPMCEIGARLERALLRLETIQVRFYTAIYMALVRSAAQGVAELSRIIQQDTTNKMRQLLCAQSLTL